MKLAQLLHTVSTDVSFRGYERPAQQANLKRLELKELRLEKLIGQERARLETVTEGDASLVLRYKGEECAVTSIEESKDGSEWNVLQVQGARSRKSFRTTACLEWQRYFADQVKAYAHSELAQVELLSMPAHFNVHGLVDSQNFEGARRTYELMCRSLGLRYSEEQARFIAEVARNHCGSILSPNQLQATEQRA